MLHRVVARGTLRLRGMSNVHRDYMSRLPMGSSLPRLKRKIGKLPQIYYRFNPARSKDRIQPAIPVGRDGRVVFMLCASALSIDGVEKRVDHHVAAVDSQLRQKSLDALSGRAYQDAPRHGLVLRRVLS